MHQNLVGIFPQTGKQLETQYACHIGSKPIITPPNIGNLAKKKNYINTSRNHQHIHGEAPNKTTIQLVLFFNG